MEKASPRTTPAIAEENSREEPMKICHTQSRRVEEEEEDEEDEEEEKEEAGAAAMAGSLTRLPDWTTRWSLREALDAHARADIQLTGRYGSDESDSPCLLLDSTWCQQSKPKKQRLAAWSL
mmetsp:Transcript_85565/g.178769  ORF Transcript_85565/g.178769 Transcript_85565/m.178769 type:complete len:121 (+) Transcript_85565:345-707(+)